jgi:nucleotide-binding universal stress UspA family protein
MSTSLALDDLRGSIVVAVDGSDHGQRALRWAACQAALEHRRLLVVGVGDGASAAVTEASGAALALHPDLTLLPHVATGDVRSVLIECSASAAMLVLGSRGLGPVRSILLGSVSAAVSAHASCPVVICRPAADQEPRGSGSGIVVGADGTPESRPVLEFAYRQAQLRGLPLTVLHSFFDAAAAVAEYRRARGLEPEMPELEDLRAGLSESVAGLAEDYPDVPVTFSLRHGLADEALTRRSSAWDLIVVGRHAMTSLDRLVSGSVATAVLERARSVVAVVPETTVQRP